MRPEGDRSGPVRQQVDLREWWTPGVDTVLVDSGRRGVQSRSRSPSDGGECASGDTRSTQRLGVKLVQVESASADAQFGRIESSRSPERSSMHLATRICDVDRTHRPSDSSDMYLCTRTDGLCHERRALAAGSGGRLRFGPIGSAPPDVPCHYLGPLAAGLIHGCMKRQSGGAAGC